MVLQFGVKFARDASFSSILVGSASQAVSKGVQSSSSSSSKACTYGSIWFMGKETWEWKINCFPMFGKFRYGKSLSSS
ncbi:unnamed protein product [Prunus armeniaca]